METSGTSPDYSPLRGGVALIDGDIVAYRAACVAEKTRYLVEHIKEGYPTYIEFADAKEAKAVMVDGDVRWERKEDLGKDLAIDACKATMDSIKINTEPSSIQVFLSGRNNFRYDIAVTKPYKGNRDYLPKPKYLRDCREYLIGEYGATVCNGIEADDGIGIASSELGDRSFVCTIDKDLDQLTGWHYNWVKDLVYRVSAKDAAFRLYSQLLTGDSTDNIPGLAGIGEAKAARILEGAKDNRDLFQRVWDQYRTGCGKSTAAEAWTYMMEQAKLVYIMRARGEVHFFPVEIPNEIRES